MCAMRIGLRFALWLALAPALGLALPSSVAQASELWLITRDGELHRLKDGTATTVARGLDKPQAMAALADGKVAVAHAGKLEIVGGKKRRTVPGRFADVVELAAPGARLCASTKAGELIEIDLASGARKQLGAFSHLGHLTADGEALIVDHDGAFEVLGGQAAKLGKITGHPIAIAAASGHLFYATREGPLWQLDWQTGRSRDLGLGGWWGTLALAAEGTHLYAVTESGKLWDIDFAAGTKRALAMDGWQNAVALALVRGAASPPANSR
jgi:hypothetical protein